MRKDRIARVFDPERAPPLLGQGSSGAKLLVEEAVRRDAAGSEPSHDRAAQRAERAFALMQAEAEDSVSITAIAGQVGIGMRCLQIAFAQHYGMTPREMLTRLRLDRARALLLAAEPDARVTLIALETGFTHLSRFSVAYHRAFGEHPVETLRRARAAPMPALCKGGVRGASQSG